MPPKSKSEYEKARDEIRAFVNSINRIPRILIVDDDESDAYFLQQKLKVFSTEIERCSDGEEAVRAILFSKFDLVMLDLALPKLSGVQVMKQTRDKCPDTKFVVITGKGLEFIDEALNEPGITIVLTKPVTQNDLVQLFGEIRI